MIHKTLKSMVALGMLAICCSSAQAEGWSWNPMVGLKSLTQPNWFTRSVSKTGTAVKTTTTNTWKSVSSTTASAWNKTTDLLDPFPDKKAPSKKTTAKSSWWSSDSASESRPETINEYLNQERPEF